MANSKIKQIQVGAVTYDIEPANSAGLSSSDITDALGYTPYSKPSGGIPSSDVAFNYAGSSSKGGAATSAAKLTNTSKIGDTNKPVYFSANGVPVAISYEVNKTVPSNAVFTDTTYTAGTGLTLSGTTINHSNSITAYTGTPSLMLLQHDAQGHITSDVKVGLSGGLNLSNDNNIVHLNSITAQTTQGFYPVKIDEYGHITAVGSRTTSFTPASHTHGNITNDGKLGTASRIVVTDSSQKITVGSIDPANLVVTTDSRLSDARTPLSHATTTTTYGVGTAASGSGASAVAGQYGHVMLIKGDLNGVNYTDGKAAASSHTHSQYLTGLTSSSVAPVGSITYVASIASSGATGTTTSVLNSLTESTTASGNLEYVKSITNTGASASGTTDALTGFTVGSGGFTPTNKYMRVSYSAGTAVRGGTTSRIKLDAGTTPVNTSSFSGTKTNALVTGVAWSTNTTKVLYGTVTSANNRNTLEIKAYDLVVSKGDYTPAGTITHTRGTAPALASTTTGGFAYISALDSVSSVGGSAKLQVNSSASTTGWSDVANTGTVFIESATHSHVAPTYSASNKATVVTGVTGGTINVTTRYLARGSTNVINAVSGGETTETTKYLKGSN